MKKLLLGLLIALLVGAAALYWGARELALEIIGPPQEKQVSAAGTSPLVDAVFVEVTPVRAQRMAQHISAVGSLLAQHAVILRAEASGRVAQIHFEEGMPASKGQLLVRLDSDILKAELQQAQAALKLATSRAHRAQELSKQGFISAQAQDESASEQAVAAAQVNMIKTKIDKSEIRAPFDGVLGLRYISVGDYINAGAEVVTIASIEQLQVDFRVPEHYLQQIQIGSPVQIRLDAQPGRVYQGQVNAMSPILDEQARSVVLRAHVPNPDAQLRPGQFARVIVEIDEIDAVLVPETALSPAGQAQYVYRLISSDTVQRVEVKVGIRRDGWVQVEGLEANDVVLTSGLQKVQDGTRVRFDPPALTASQP